MIFNFKTLEQILIQFSFIIFFIGTLFSWIKLIIPENKKVFEKPSSQKKFFLWSQYTTVVPILFGFLSVTGLCIIRWNLSDHLPLSNLYESSLFLAWSLIFIYLIFKNKIKSEWVDAIIAPIILLTTTFSTLGLPKELQESTALVPALQSNWLMMHVTMMILSYGALIFGSLLSVTLLTLTFVANDKNDTSAIPWNPTYKTKILNNLNQTKYTENFIPDTKVHSQPENSFSISKNNETISNSTIAITFYPPLDPLWNLNESGFLKLIYLQKYKAVLVNQLDYWSYRIIGIGFPLLTLGILSGAVWANDAWGSYWNWDPKETWALITWIIFAIYLHIRITKGWNGTKPALVALLGFFVVWMCFLGVNLLGKGLHSYGWLT